MQLSAKELRFLSTLVNNAIMAGKAELAALNEDSDEYVERANDLMVLDVLLSKLTSGSSPVNSASGKD